MSHPHSIHLTLVGIEKAWRDLPTSMRRGRPSDDELFTANFNESDAESEFWSRCFTPVINLPFHPRAPAPEIGLGKLVQFREWRASPWSPWLPPLADGFDGRPNHGVFFEIKWQWLKGGRLAEPPNRITVQVNNWQRQKVNYYYLVFTRTRKDKTLYWEQSCIALYTKDIID